MPTPAPPLNPPPPTTDITEVTTPRTQPSRAAAALLAAAAILLIPGCEETPTRTVANVKADYAARFVEGLDFGAAGRIKAESLDPETLDLNNVQVDDGPDRLYHADLARIHINTDTDTIVIEFIGITGVNAAEGGITQTPAATSPPVQLPFDVIP